MTYHIQDFLNRHKKIIDKMKNRPIVERWLQSEGMAGALSIMDKHVEYLLNNGGSEKLKQWFLVDDENFNSITAERYILAYLKQRNKNIRDNLKHNGVDGFLDNNGGLVGIEITTLNGLISDWVFVERLIEYLDKHNYWSIIDGLEIKYSLERVKQAKQGKTLYEYIIQTSEAIISNDRRALAGLEISINHLENVFGISFNAIDADAFSWFSLLTQDVEDNLNRDEKLKQLAKQDRNIVFVGLNNTCPSNGVFPRLFGYLTSASMKFRPEIDELEAFWFSSLPHLKNIIGICYFFYSLPSEVPFYPLKIFWRSDRDTIDINL